MANLMKADRLFIGPQLCSSISEREGALARCKVVENDEALRASFHEVMGLLKPVMTEALNDFALAHAMLRDEDQIDPLTKFEWTVLACGVFQEARTDGDGFDYGDVLELTDRFQSRAMNTTTIYKTVVSLQQKGLVASIGKNLSSKGRAADHFVVTKNGRTAFRLAAATLFQLKLSRESVAA